MNVYIVDPDLSEIMFVRDCLQDTEFTPVGFHNGLFLGVSPRIPSIAILSLKQEYENGLTLCKELRNLNPDIRLILTSTLDISPYECRILEAVDLILLKPFGRSELLACLRSLSTTRDQ